MKHSLLIALLALSCGSAFAQTPPSSLPQSPGQSSPTASGDMPAAKGSGAGTTGMGTGMGMGMGMKSMDTNGDGMISKKEWDAHHAMMWRKMSKNGKISMADMEAMMKRGSN